ncbi:hypothetical protein tb265_48900 [Gemmatimonadetes bacterium T265]|nr:hypothetical protein tb265_48900 [Gemmatimonadetes bacterium T265]
MSRRRASRASPAAGGRPAPTAHGAPARDRPGAERAALDVARRAGNAALGRALEDAAGGRAGAPLDAGLAARQARALGRPVDGVRVVDDAAAHAAARSLDAAAFAVGRTVFLGPQAPQLGSAAGARLLSHELAHVLQQEDAGPAREARVGAPGDAHERAADRAAAGGGVAPVAGAPAALQREPATRGAAPAPAATDAPDRTPPATVARAELTEILRGYFERVLAQQGGRGVRVTDDVKVALRRAFLGDPMGEIGMSAYLDRPSFPGAPAALAAEVAQRMPDPIARARVAHLVAGPATSPAQGTLARVGDLAASTAPAVTPEQQQSQWAFDQAAKDLRRNENAVGPFGLDLQRAFAVGRGLPKALKGPGAAGPAERSYPAVDAAVNAVAPGALTPAEVAGTPAADEYADAQVVARTLARDLDVAQQQRRGVVPLRFGANYLKAKDRDGVVAAVARVVALVRDALPHHASAVDAVDLYFGEFRVRRIPLGATAE